MTWRNHRQAARCHSIALLFLALALGACGHDDAPPRRAGDLLYSPNGEPLTGGPLGRPRCAEAMGRWFDRVDADRDGTIDKNEFIADARRQFAAMDLDKDGIITPATLEAYRAPYRAPNAGEDAETAADEPEVSIFGGFRRNEKRREGPDPADPVMSADRDLRFKVTLPEFLAHAERVFARLDRKGAGRLSRAEILTACRGG